VVKLRVAGIHRWFARPGEAPMEVLRDVSLDVGDGEIVAVVGPSGCGKTTLLRIVHGLIAADSGVVEVGGVAVRAPGYDRALVFQQPRLLLWRTARDNAALGLELKGVAREERQRIVQRYLAMVGLAGFEDYFPGQLSGGMQQRVALSRALAVSPSVLLMDEPFASLDAQTKETLQTELLRIHVEARTTVLFVPHDLDEAVYLADRVIVLRARPGMVSEVVDVPIVRPRRDPIAVKRAPEFVATRARLAEALVAALQ
jgi:NitT/TauT family transport system ATP-binding protein